MSDNELLSAISNMMDEKMLEVSSMMDQKLKAGLKPIENRLDKMDAVITDNELIKKVVTEHSDKFQKLA